MQCKGRRTITLLSTLLAVSASTLWHLPKALGSADEFTGSSTATGLATTQIPVPIALGSSATAAADGNYYVTAEVAQGELIVPHTTGITFYGTNQGDVIRLRGNRENVTQALQSLAFIPDTLDSVSVFISSLTFDEAYNRKTGHFYRKVPAPGTTWAAAKAAAEASTRDGVPGYLATITTQAESQFTRANFAGLTWIGASDSAVEGDWNWVSGPDNGTLFYQGDTYNWFIPDDMFTDWAFGEPNNVHESFPDADCGAMDMGIDGYWQDQSCDSTLDSYIIEYGTNSNLPVVDSKIVVVTPYGPTKSIATCSELSSLDGTNDRFTTLSLTADIDCEDATLTPILGGIEFKGIFEGNGHTIRNATFASSTGDAGMFSSTYAATIQNLQLESITAEAINDAGALIGYADGTTILNVKATDVDIKSLENYSVGGLVGFYDIEDGREATISYSSATGTIINEEASAGGLIGGIALDDGSLLTIQKSWADVTITSAAEHTFPGGYSSIGGFIGYLDFDGVHRSSENSRLIIEDSYSHSDVTLSINGYLGGFIGEIESNGEKRALRIERSYASGTVSNYNEPDFEAPSIQGGFIGVISGFSEEAGAPESPLVSNSFSTAVVYDSPSVLSGGFTGSGAVFSTEVSFSGNYYDFTRASEYFPDGVDEESIAATAVNVDGTDSNYFVNTSSVAPLTSWDFTDVWQKNSADLPTLRAYIPPPPSPSPSPSTTPTPSASPSPSPSSSPTTDSDSDGVEDSIERSAPNNGDGNNDGTLDVSQRNVTSLVSASGNYLNLTVDATCTLREVSSKQESANSVLDPAYSYSEGFLHFTAACGTPGFTTQVAILLYTPEESIGEVRKYIPRSNAYSTISDAVVSQTTVGSRRVTRISYSIKDGSSIDVDGLTNGVIVDPVALGTTTLAAPNTGIGGLQMR